MTEPSSAKTGDEWRVQIDFREEGHAAKLGEDLEARELEHDLSEDFGQRVIVSRDGARVFLYAGSRDQAEKGRALVESLATEQGWALESDLKRWHPVAEEWEDPDRPLPGDGASRAAEREELMAREREEAADGHIEFEVHVTLPSRREAARFAARLDGEGLPTVHRWRWVLLGASDEDSAKALAGRIRSEAPAGSEVGVEGTWQVAWREWSRNPFAFLGGLAG